MKDALETLEKALSLGFGAAFATAAILYVVRGAVAKAVELTGERELEQLKDQLAKQMETERQRFTAALERERSAAAKDLEAFKADLTLRAEVRRQVAAKKVEAIEEIMSVGEPLIRDVLNARPGDPDAQAGAIAKVNGYVVRVRALAHYFEEPVAQKFRAYASKLLEAKARWDQKIDPQAFESASEAYTDLLETVRRELGITP
ncbi:MAG: hypothetical protein ACRENE_01050 [Polyangiaceae bacterium]